MSSAKQQMSPKMKVFYMQQVALRVPPDNYPHNFEI